MQSIQRASFYFVAHADDWQLFMAPEVSRDIADKQCKVMIVHLTAGDAGNDERYWKAREAAAIESLQFRTSIDDRIHHSEKVFIDGSKKIRSVTINNCSCYFLRLPDGAYDGNGFPAYNHQSLDKFRSGNTGPLISLDKEAVYTDWADLTNTVDAIIGEELSELRNLQPTDICLNIPENDNQLNPHDHNDHYNTSFLLSNTIAFKTYRKRAFLDYSIVNTDSFLADEDLFWKIGMFASYHQSLFREYGHSTISEERSMIPWCFRNSVSREL